MNPYDALMLELIPTRLPPPPPADLGPTARWMAEHPEQPLHTRLALVETYQPTQQAGGGMRIYSASCDCGYTSRGPNEQTERQRLATHDCERWRRVTQPTVAQVVSAFERASELTRNNGFVLSYDGHRLTLDFPCEDPTLAAPMADDDEPLAAIHHLPVGRTA